MPECKWCKRKLAKGLMFGEENDWACSGCLVLESFKSLRKTWKINPKTRVKESKKKYKRSQVKRQLKKEIGNDQ